MKKLISLLLTFMLLLGCTALAQEAVNYTGYWVMTGVEVNGAPVDPSALGLSAYMELYEDGSCLLVMMDEVQEGSWAATEYGIETTDAEGIVDPFTYVNGALVIENEGNKLIFTQGAYTVPLTGLTAADFNGDWEFVYAEVLGEVYDAAELGMAISLHLEDGKGHMVMSFPDGAEEYDAVCEVKEIEGFGTAMYFLILDEAGQPDGSGLMLMMYDNGELVWYEVDEDNTELFYCFVSAEE